LNIVAPHGDPDYLTLRPTIGATASQISQAKVDLDGFFAFSPWASSLMPLFQAGELAVIHAAGSHNETRSHFVAMDYMDQAFGSDGWLQRGVGATGSNSPIAGLSIGARPSPSLLGSLGAPSLQTLADFQASRNFTDAHRARLIRLHNSDPTLAPLTKRGFDAATALSGLNSSSNMPYQTTDIGSGLQEAALLVKADVGIRAITVDMGGWDHHDSQMLSNPGKFPERMGSLAHALAMFREDLGEDLSRTTVLIMSEFGRAAAQNGSLGTDHGHGNMMMVLGGGVRGGSVRVRDGWPGLADLHDSQDLKITTDFRDVFADVVDHQFGHAAVAPALAGYSPTALGLFASDADRPPITNLTFGSDNNSLLVAWGGTSLPIWVSGSEVQVKVDKVGTWGNVYTGPDRARPKMIIDHTMIPGIYPGEVRDEYAFTARIRWAIADTGGFTDWTSITVGAGHPELVGS
jgi:uncharacterized protein (DUF1501 family)